MIRIATIEDIPAIVALGSRSMVDGPYAGQGTDNPEQSEKLARYIVEGQGKVLLWMEDGKAVGMLGFVIFPHHFRGECTCQELAWYVLPEYRAGGAGMKLFWEAERMAKELGAKRIQFSAPSEKVGSIYKRYGFSQIEVCYEKVL